jgi:hypothetical protein
MWTTNEQSRLMWMEWSGGGWEGMVEDTEKNKECEFHPKCSEFQNLVIFQ